MGASLMKSPPVDQRTAAPATASTARRMSPLSLITGPLLRVARRLSATHKGNERMQEMHAGEGLNGRPPHNLTRARTFSRPVSDVAFRTQPTRSGGLHDGPQERCAGRS